MIQIFIIIIKRLINILEMYLLSGGHKLLSWRNSLKIEHTVVYYNSIKIIYFSKEKILF